jgi:hypothetical protein
MTICFEFPFSEWNIGWESMKIQIIEACHVLFIPDKGVYSGYVSARKRRNDPAVQTSRVRHRLAGGAGRYSDPPHQLSYRAS